MDTLRRNHAAPTSHHRVIYLHIYMQMFYQSVWSLQSVAAGVFGSMGRRSRNARSSLSVDRSIPSDPLPKAPPLLDHIVRIVSRPYHQSRLSGAHKTAHLVARMCTKQLPATLSMIPILLDTELGECARVTIHPTFAKKMKGGPACHNVIASLRSDVAMVMTPMNLSEIKSTMMLYYVRDAALAWVEHWCEANGVPVARLLLKALSLARANAHASGDEDDHRGNGDGGNDGKVGGNKGERSSLGRVAIFDWDTLIQAMPDYSCGACGALCRSTCMGNGCTKRYCSRKCQLHDWPRHKNECSQATEGGYARFRKGPFAEFVKSGNYSSDVFCSSVMAEITR